MSALIPAIIGLIISGMRKGGGGGGGELSPQEKAQRYNSNAIMRGDMTYGKEGGKLEFPPQKSYTEITGRRGGK